MTSARADLWVAAAFAGATALSRLPFTTRQLWEWDSVLYARALEQGFQVSDVLARSRPHPPGYVFYVASAGLARALGLGTNDALVAVSVVASALGAAAAYLIFARLAGRAVAAFTTLGIAASPLFWLHGEVASPYALLVPLSALLALAMVAARRRGTGAAIGASAALGLAAGFRQDILIFLGPLWLWAILPSPPRTRSVAMAAAGIACLTWFVPSALLSGGPLAYLDSTGRQFTSLSGTTAMGPRSIEGNVAIVGEAVGWTMLLFGLILIGLVLARLLAVARGSRVHPIERWQLAFLTLWIVPPLFFFTIVHVGEWGQLLALAPPLFALTAVLLRGPFDELPARARALLGGALVAAAMVSAAFFVGGGDPVFSAAGLAEHDRSTLERTAYVRTHHGPADTLILAGPELLVAGHYLPGYAIAFSDDRATGTYERHLTRATAVVVYAPSAAPRAPDLSAALRPGYGLAIMTLPAGSVLVLNGREVDAGPAP